MSPLPFVFALSLLTPRPTFATTPREIDRAVIARMHGARRGEKIVLPNVMLSANETRTIELEEFSVYAPDAAILVYDSDPPRRIDPPARRYFRGRVADDPTAMVFFSLSTNSSDVDGLIVIGERRFAIGRGRRLLQQPTTKAEREEPILVAEIDPFADGFADMPFKCGTENLSMPMGQLVEIRHHPISLAVPPTAYQLRIAIETDNAFYAGFGAPDAATDTAVNNYIGNLVAQASVIYMRDLNTTLNIGQVNIRPSNVPDPWSVQPSDGILKALGEFGTYWHNNYQSVSRSAAAMLSGRFFGGGIAWRGRLCRGDFSCGLGCFGDPSTAGQYGGAYAFNGSLSGVEVVVADPNATVDGVLYGLPVDNYWMLQSFAHELGHLAGSPHTHCVSLSADEKTLYGVTRDFVDQCFSGESGCYDGLTSVPPEKGTTMSYCYLSSTAGGFPASRYLFGEAGKPSEKMLAILTQGLDNAVPTGFITIGSNVPCAPGQTASVFDCGTGCTYSWTITGGSIQGSAAGSSISFTPTAADLTVTVTITDVNGCGITTSSATTSLCGTGAAAPTVSTVSPISGSTNGGTSVTITGTGFAAGATVTFGGTAATNVIVASATTITATTPAHAAGAVDVVVRNTDGQSGTLAGGFTYSTAPHGDANGDGNVTVADVFYLINFLFTGGPAPIGIGDSNGDASVTVADIFYLINYLFSAGPAPR